MSSLTELRIKLNRAGFDPTNEAGGQAAGTMEIDNADPHEAIEKLNKEGVDIIHYVPDFVKNFKLAQKMARKGWTVRKDMPVIDGEAQVKNFQQLLKKGYLDIVEPFSKKTLADIKKTGNPWPQGLTRAAARKFLSRGIEKMDGSATDDQVSVTTAKLPVKSLKPIQKQIYFGKCIKGYSSFGFSGTQSFLRSSSNLYVVSSDNYILDGHHRWLSSMVMNPDLTVNCVVIDLPLNKLLPLALAVGDVYNKGKRNQ